jgi:hypothetical protein
MTNVVPLPMQVRRHDLGDGGVVIDDQDPAHAFRVGAIHSRRCLAMSAFTTS